MSKWSNGRGATSNKITLFLKEKRFKTLPIYAKTLDLNKNSLANTFYGIKPVKKVVEKLFKEDKEIFDMLPTASKNLIQGGTDSIP